MFKKRIYHSDAYQLWKQSEPATVEEVMAIGRQVEDLNGVSSCLIHQHAVVLSFRERTITNAAQLATLDAAVLRIFSRLHGKPKSKGMWFPDARHATDIVFRAETK